MTLFILLFSGQDARAAQVSRQARSDLGSDVTEWFFAWRTVRYARCK